ncbi:GLPGLI family protein [Chryseobacterium daecheongense]|nr:GLPGLI family protein [Chryseobacterium daecheongense]
MKKILSIVSIFLFGIVLSQNKKFKVFKSHTQIIYNVDFKADSTLSTKSDDMLTLYIGDNESIFQNDKKYKIDSIIDSQPFFQMSSRPMFKVSHVIKKDYQQSDLIYSDKIENINFGYKEKSPAMQWKLIDEKKNVLTYECYKAEATFRGRKFIAWYTKDIPIADGPYKFAGLPGLILEVYDDQENFHYKLLAITKKSQNILYDENINFIDRKKMIEARMNVIKKFTKGNIKINPIEKN